MNIYSFENLRNQFPTFIFEGFRVFESRESLVVHYSYQIPGLSEFTSVFTFPLSGRPLSSEGSVLSSELRALLAKLGMIEALSYWKCVCSPRFIVRAPDIQSTESTFWSTLWYLGLGEFRYRNGISCEKNDFVWFDWDTSGDREVKTDFGDETRHFSGNLLPIGGGKDSIVSLELLRGEKEQNHLFLFNPRPACFRTASIGGYGSSQIVVCSRNLDKRLLHLNNEGYLNGHTPFSALLGFSSLVTAYLLGKEHIILSNEGSASESNVIGSEINHQYSKSFEFEQDFNTYIKRYCTSGIRYFSLLRPIHEVQIARLFSNYPQYFSAFRSCNVGCYSDSWCSTCPKCLFTALILSPFVDQHVIASIFPHNPLDNPALSPVLLDLCLPERLKPFECVGTREESLACVHYLQRHSLPPLKLLRGIGEELPTTRPLENLLVDWGEDILIPKRYKGLLESAVLERTKI